jgi:N-acetylneuraminic acid mutarotase
VAALSDWRPEDVAGVAGAFSGAAWGVVAYRGGGAWSLAAMFIVWVAFAHRSWRMR